MRYRYQKIDLEQFAILTEGPVERETKIGFNTSIQFAYSRENRVFANKITVEASADGTKVLKAVIASYFEIAEDSVAEATDSDGKIVFDPVTLIQFASLNYGALRGALYVKTADTALKDIVLPPVYLQKIITSAFIVE